MNKREIDDALNKIARGDNDALGRLYAETRRGVYAFLFSYFKNKDDCEDALQTTYLKVKQNAAKYSSGNGLAWILQIAKNVALNELRAKANREKFQSEAIKSDCAVAEPNCGGTLMDLMKKILDEDEQRIVALHAVAGYKHKEIAKFLNCPVGTVTSKYKRAADKLKSAYEEERL